jgi:acetylornithine deacetylase/succinyl-diaminopimelate desuccinylase-like protein
VPGQPPTVVGRIPAPPGAPTVLLYAHYDVQPPGPPEDWLTPPFEPVVRGDALFGRGSADDKGNFAMHLGAIRAWRARPPVGVTVVVEGQEEYGSGLAGPLAQGTLSPALVAALEADVAVIADTGNIRPGVPTLGLSLRGVTEVDVEVRTLPAPVHSGGFGGIAPDALLALVRALNTLVDDVGGVAVPGLSREQWADELMAPTVPLLAGILPWGDAATVYAGPAITVIGLDAPATASAVNAVPGGAKARISLRLAPGEDPVQAQDALVAHLESLSPFGIPLLVTRRSASAGVRTDPASPAALAARHALQEGWQTEAVLQADGGSVPFAGALHRLRQPSPEILLFGVQDAESGLHGPNERVLLSELERGVATEAHLLGLL